MKKNKILTSIFSGIAITVIPLSTIVLITGCGSGDSFEGNLMKELIPTTTPIDVSLFNECDKPIQVNNLYINRTQAFNDAFRQDLVYTMSRGLTKYNEYLIDNGVIITSNNFDIRVNDITPKADLTISFVGSMIVQYDYSKSSPEALTKCNIKDPKANKTIKFKMVLDLDTSAEKGFVEVDAKYRQLTARADDAIEMGVSEIGSTIEDLDVDEPTPYHFINPQEDYWKNTSTPEQYNTRLNEIEAINGTDLRIPVALFNYYLGTQPYQVIKTPNTFEFGSYYFQKMELNDGLEIYTDSSNNIICNGYNFSNRLSTNLEKIRKSEWLIDESFTMPKYDSKGQKITILANNSFMQDGQRGLPDDIEKITISNNYISIGTNSIACNTSENNVQELYFAKESESDEPVFISQNAFGTMLNLGQINLCEYSKEDFSIVKSWRNAFSKIHEGWDEQIPYEGIIIIPKGSSIDAWNEALYTAGLRIRNYQSSLIGWTVVVDD